MSASALLTKQEVGYLRHLASAGDKMADLLMKIFDRVGHGGKDLVVVKAATTANRTLSGLTNTNLDGITPADGDLVLVKSQTTGSQNGIYITRSGAWERLKDDVGADVLKAGMLVVIQRGTTLQDTTWELATDTFTVGTTSLSFNQLVTSVGDGTISTAKLADTAVTTAKLDDGAVTDAKLDDGAVSTAKLADAAVTYAKLDASVFGAPQLIVAAGATAVDLTTRTTHVDGDAAGDDVTSSMADGTVDGQRKTLVLGKITSAKTWVVTPTHLFNGTTITFDAAGDCAELEWSASMTMWFLVGGTGYAVA